MSGSASHPTGGRLAYVRIIEDVIRSGITHADLGRAVGASLRTVQDCAAGATMPTGVKAQRLLDVQDIQQSLVNPATVNIEIDHEGLGDPHPAGRAAEEPDHQPRRRHHIRQHRKEEQLMPKKSEPMKDLGATAKHSSVVGSGVFQSESSPVCWLQLFSLRSKRRTYTL